MNEEYKTLRELDVQPGDVVENNTGSRKIIAYTDCDECCMESGHPWLWNNPIWRIVSRASDTPKPIRDMTDAEIGALVRAKNEGKAIEVADTFNGAWEPAPEPGWYASVAYRVRPEPKRETVKLWGYLDRGYFHIMPGANDTHIITFDLIDGKPDCDSVRMKPL